MIGVTWVWSYRNRDIAGLAWLYRGKPNIFARFPIWALNMDDDPAGGIGFYFGDRYLTILYHLVLNGY